VFGTQLRGRLGDAIGRFLQSDKLVLGICNGFQVLVKAGILPDGAAGWSSDIMQPRDTTLTWNVNGKSASTPRSGSSSRSVPRSACSSKGSTQLRCRSLTPKGGSRSAIPAS
jgi:hypothetical protein